MKKLTKAEWEKVVAVREAVKVRAAAVSEARCYLRSLADERALSVADSLQRRDKYDEHRHTCLRCDDEELCSTGRRIYNEWCFEKAR